MKRAHKRITSSENDPITNRQLNRDVSGASSFGYSSGVKKLIPNDSGMHIDAGMIRETAEYKPILTIGLMRGPNYPFHTIDNLP